MEPSKGHWLIYGEVGSGKSTGAASWPKPMLVCMFDPLSKERPYLYTRAGKARGIVTRALEDTVLVDTCVDDKGALVVRVEHYIDANAKDPHAYSNFLARMVKLHDDIVKFGIKTLVLDSVTFMELAARKEQQYRINPQAREPRQWFAGATDTLEEVLMIQLGSLPIDVLVLAHVDEDRDELHGTMVRNPSAPGRLRKRSPAGYGEVYRSYVQRDGDNSVYLWQTRSDQYYNALSLFNVPNPCHQGYKELWLP